jgi:hypothetical protein
MRLLIYAMQSSGASAFCYFLGQRPGSIAVVDVWSREITPPLKGKCPVVAKATVNCIFSIADHIASFGPDRTILFLRDPVAVYASLARYPYANRFGSIEDKMARLDDQFARGSYDGIVRYEDFVEREPNFLAQVGDLGWPCDASYYEASRSLAEIERFNKAASYWLAQHGGDGWGFGNVKSGGIRKDFARRLDDPEIAARVAPISPKLYSHYLEYWRTKAP